MKQQLSLVTAILNLFWVGASAAVFESYYPNATTSFFSSTTGPWLGVNSYTWSRYIWPTTVGTIEVIINTDTNRTFTTTRMNTGYSANGSLAILTRTDTNLAGTVTGIGQDPYGAKITAAYPTPVLAPATDFTWAAMLPSVYHGSSCCFLQTTKSLTPSHTPFASPTGATDTADPSGWLYTLVGVLFSDPETTLPSNNFSAMWTGQSFGFPYSGCPYTACDNFAPSAAGATAVQSQAYLFAVRTVTTSGVDLLSLASGIPTSSPSVTSGVEADPTSAAPTSNPETSSLPSFSLFMQTSLPQSSTANAHQTVSMAVETATLITKSTVDMSLPLGIFGSQVETKPSTYVITESATGAATTVSGSVISLGSGATEDVFGTSTESEASPSELGGYTWSEVGGSSTVPSNPDSGIFPNSSASSVSASEVVASSTPETSQRSVTPTTSDGETATGLMSSSAQTVSSSDAAQPRRQGMGLAGLSILALSLYLM